MCEGPQLSHVPPNARRQFEKQKTSGAIPPAPEVPLALLLSLFIPSSDYRPPCSQPAKSNRSNKSPIAGVFVGAYRFSPSVFGLVRLSRLRPLTVGRFQSRSMYFSTETWSVDWFQIIPASINLHT